MDGNNKFPTIPTKQNVSRAVAIGWANDFERLYPETEMFIVRDLHYDNKYTCGKLVSMENGVFEFMDGITISKKTHCKAML